MMGDQSSEMLRLLQQDSVGNFELLFHFEHNSEACFWLKDTSYLVELPATHKAFLQGEESICGELLNHLSLDHYLIQIPYPLLPLLRRAFIVRTVETNLLYVLRKEDFLPARDARVRPLIPRGFPICYQVGEEKLSLETFYGLFLDDQVVSYGGTQFETQELAEIAWLRTDENHQHKGYATKVVSAVVEDLLEEDKLPIYRVSADNLASRRVAERLGFTLHGEFLYVTVRR
jgi:GNAT superfamily N-acetyltransferase